MKLNKQILEAVQRGINLALDDFDDEELVGQLIETIKNQNITKDYLELLDYVVDLGLPSGTLWCKYNLGCDFEKLNNNLQDTVPKDWYGDYYAWGETETKGDYSMPKYKFAKVTYINQHKPSEKTITEYTKYCHFIDDGYRRYIDYLTLLEPEDDVAHVKLGKKYCIPTVEDFEELFKYTIQEYKRNYCGVTDLNGVLFTSIADNSKTMFIPCAGLRCANTKWNPNGESCIGFEVHLWTSTFGKFINTGCASAIEGKLHKFDVGLGKCEIKHSTYRFYGLPIRPIYKTK